MFKDFTSLFRRATVNMLQTIDSETKSTFLYSALLSLFDCLIRNLWPFQAYMEDHLKNKDRLEQEWEALCAYEAEPNSTTVACETANMRKNRYSDVLPCK